MVGAPRRRKPRRPAALDPVFSGRVAVVGPPANPLSGDRTDEHLDSLRPGDEVKFVVKDRADFEFALELIRDRGLEQVGCPLLFSPVHGSLDPATLAG